MPKVKWLGMVQNTRPPCQQGELPAGAQLLKLPGSAGGLQRRAAVVLPLPLAVVFGVMLGKTYGCGQIPVTPLGIGLGVCLGIPALALHELLHALPYPKDAQVGIGFYPKALAAVALVSYPLSRRRFVLMALLPFLLGAVPLLLFLLAPVDWRGLNGFLFGFGAMGLVSPYPDLYLVAQALRQTSKGCCLQFVGDGLYSLPCNRE